METAVFVTLALACIALGVFCRFLYAENRALKMIKPMVQEAGDLVELGMMGPQLYEARSRAERAEAALRDLREELERRMESHERVVGVLIKERDTWQQMYHNFDRAFDGTMGFYEARIQEFQALTGQMLRSGDREKLNQRIGEVIKIRNASRNVPRVEVSKGEDGMFKEERPA